MPASVAAIRIADCGEVARRSRRRYRSALLATLAAGVAKALGLAVTLLSAPVTAPYLGAQRFGLFMTLSAIPVLLSFADLGIGNGLMTELSAAHGRDDRAQARVLVSSAFFILLAIAVALLLLFAAGYALLPWDRVFNIQSPQAAAEVGPSLAVLAISIALNMPLGVVQRVQQGYQQGYAANLWMGLGNALAFVALLGFVALRKPLPWLVAAVAGGPLAALLLNWIQEFMRSRPWLRPRWSLVHPREAARLARAGLLIFSSQLGATVLLTSPVFLLARQLGQEAVASYGLLQRLFWIFVTASMLVTTPLWPAYAEAAVRRDREWIRKTFSRSLAANLLIAGLPIVVAALFAPRIVRLFSAKSFEPTPALAAATALLCFLEATRHAVSMLVNGCGYLRRAALAFPIAALLTGSLFLLAPGALPDFAVPLAVAAAELGVIAILLTDARRALSLREDSRS